MEFFKNFDFSFSSILKLIGMGILGLLALSIIVSLVGFAFRTAFFGGSNDYYESEYYAPQAIRSDYAMEGAKLSQRNIIPQPGYTTGSDAEDFEVTEYSGTIRTRKLDEVCFVLEDLKRHDHVIFEDAQKYDKGCSYVFKVENDRVDDVLPVVKELKPKTFQANTKTIKRNIDDYTSEVEILNKKLASVEETLAGAQQAYDEITALATKTKDVESLAKIIDSKINLIERLTSSRISIKEQIDRLERSKAEQLDKLNYTFFRINVYEYLIFDWKSLKDSWMNEFRSFVNEFNDVLQDITVNLAEFMMRLVQAAIYLFIALFMVKYGWRFVKYFWKGRTKAPQESQMPQNPQI